MTSVEPFVSCNHGRCDKYIFDEVVCDW
jgi:hypothetical protein